MYLYYLSSLSTQLHVFKLPKHPALFEEIPPHFSPLSTQFLYCLSPQAYALEVFFFSFLRNILFFFIKICPILKLIFRKLRDKIVTTLSILTVKILGKKKTKLLYPFFFSFLTPTVSMKTRVSLWWYKPLINATCSCLTIASRQKEGYFGENVICLWGLIH